MTEQNKGVTKVAHNLGIATVYNHDAEKYVHALSVVVSDVDNEAGQVKKSEQFTMHILPNMEPDTVIGAFRSLADTIEQYCHEA